MTRKKRKEGGHEAAFFVVKKGQIALLLLAVLGIAFLASWSVYSSSPHQVEKLAILSESNDAASLAYSQRESFNVALSLEQWVRNDSTIRDVEITRALLGQRLQVTLVDGSSTYQAMSKAYRDNLAVIDQFIINEAESPSANRAAAFAKIADNYENFLTQTRRMSKTIQQVSLMQVNKVVKNRTQSEFYQSAIIMLIILCSLTLAWWVAKDILRAFRKSRKILEDEQVKLGQAIEMLELSRALDSFQKFALDITLESNSHVDFAQLFEVELNKLLPMGEFAVEHVNETYALSRKTGSKLSDEMFDFAELRFNEVIRQHIARTRLYFEAQYRAQHDLLTGFMNERGLSTYALESHTSPPTMLAGIFIDVDRFHRINDSMGFQFGDATLLEISKRIKSFSSNDDVLVRISSDEFLVIKPCSSEEEARSLALQLQSDLQYSTINDGIEFNLTFTVGLVPMNAQNMRMSDLLHQGALTLNLAQQQLRNGFAIYSSDQSQEFIESLAEEYALRQALKLNEFELYFQPVVELKTGEVTGGEALIRWNRPGHGIVYPNEFLPAVRELQLHVELGEWVIDNALQMIKSARLFEHELKMSEFKVGINVEQEQLNLSDFADNLINKLARNGIKPREVSIEVTEYALIASDIAFQQLVKLKAAGFVIAIDDFGTGYSNLSQVHSLPATVLKIDKSFLIEGPGRTVDKQLVIDIKHLADNLKLRVVAEGVEDQETVDFLLEAGITRHQGYFYSQPLPEKEFWQWMRDFYARQAVLNQ